MLAGWGLRTSMVFALAAVPLLAFVDAPTKVALILLLLVGFSILRGVVMGVWLPWITELLPPGKRGTYLSREQMAVHGGSLAALGISALTLQYLPHPYRYSAIFFLSAVAGLASLLALRRMPDAEPSEVTRSSSQAVPWRAIVRFPPFRKVILFTSLWAIAVGSMGTFSVAFSRDVLHLTESRIIFLTLFAFGGALSSLPFTAGLMRAIGIKHALRLSILLTIGVAVGWFALAAGVWPGSWWAVALLNALLGVSSANFGVVNSALAMGVMPVMGRNHFFALYTVVTSLAMGASPILFGVILDALRDVSGEVGSWSINRYSLYFAITGAILGVTLLSVSILREHEMGAMSGRDFTIFNSLRRLGRLFGR